MENIEKRQYGWPRILSVLDNLGERVGDDDFVNVSSMYSVKRGGSFPSGSSPTSLNEIYYPCRGLRRKLKCYNLSPERLLFQR